MKRTVSIILVLIMLLALFACGNEKAAEQTATAGKAETETAPTLTEPATEEPAESTESAEEPAVTEAELTDLFDRNLVCTLNVFDLNQLQYEEAGADGLHKVTDPRFADFAELEAFVRSTYTAATAEEILFGESVPGHTLYVNKDGAIYIDERAIGGKGYYVDWSRYTVSIDSCTEDRCEFTVTASITEPGENTSPEPYVKTATAVFEDGAWLLTERVY